jgi:hypothetical protein
MAKLITQDDLLKFSKSPHQLLGFLTDHPLHQRQKAKTSGDGLRLNKSIVAFHCGDGLSENDGNKNKRGTLGSALHVVQGNPKLPMIRRTGKYSPAMLVAPLEEYGARDATNRNEQRIGCDFITPALFIKHFNTLLERVLHAIKALQASSSNGVIDKAAQGYVCEVKSHAVRHFVILQSKFHSQLVDSCADVIQRLLDNPPTELIDISVLDYVRTHKPEYDPDGRFFKLLRCHFYVQATQVCEPSIQTVENCDLEFPVIPLRVYEERTKEFSDKIEKALQRRIFTLFASIASSAHLSNHYRHLNSKHELATNVVIQGAGNISMNKWNVAAIREIDPKDGNSSKLRLVHVEQEELESRRYTCLLAFRKKYLKGDVPCEDSSSEIMSPESRWKKIQAAQGNKDVVMADGLVIGTVCMNRYAQDRDKVRLVTDDGMISIGDMIEYALYGQALVYKGEIREPQQVVHQFADIRHVLDLPNLNPREFLSDQEFPDRIQNARKKLEELLVKHPHLFDKDLLDVFKERPRPLFGLHSREDVRLGEFAFLNNPRLLRTAVEHAVELPLSDLGAPLDWISLCLLDWGYNYKNDHEKVLVQGDFSWNLNNPTDPRLVWFPKRPHYPCTMIGIGRLVDGSVQDVDSKDSGDSGAGTPALFLLAWGHSITQTLKYSIFDCAKLLANLGAESVLLMDEGGDVFQYQFEDIERFGQYLRAPAADSPHALVPPLRSQVRGSVGFWIDDE